MFHDGHQRPGARLSRSAIVGAVVVLVAFGLAAILFVSGDAADQRLALFFAMLGPTMAGLLAALRSDQAATQTNGVNTRLTEANADLAASNAKLQQDIDTAVQAALAAHLIADPAHVAEATAET